MKRKIFISVLIAYSFFACGHKHEAPSENIKKAYAIQQGALKEVKTIEALLPKLADAQRVQWQNKKEQWVQNMVEIDGMEHDHSNCKHGHVKVDYGVSDAEMIKVQTEWRDSILQLKKDILAASK